MNIYVNIKYILLGTILFSTTLLAQVTIGEKLPSYTLEDQFEKKHILTSNIKKIIFAFSKENGHIIKEYMKNKPSDFLTSKDIIIIADISRMPSIISYLFAKPDMKKSKYPILLIEDEEFAKNYLVEGKKDFFMIVELENTVVKSIKFIQTKDELKSIIEK